jgi:hypothetical protein
MICGSFPYYTLSMCGEEAGDKLVRGGRGERGILPRVGW